MKFIVIEHDELIVDNEIMWENHSARAYASLEEAATIVKFKVEKEMKRYKDYDFETASIANSKNIVSIMGKSRGNLTSHITYFIIRVKC